MNGFNVMAAVPNVAFSGKKGPRLRDMFVIKERKDGGHQEEEPNVIKLR